MNFESTVTFADTAVTESELSNWSNATVIYAFLSLLACRFNDSTDTVTDAQLQMILRILNFSKTRLMVLHLENTRRGEMRRGRQG